MANDLKFSLVLTADASAAKRETSEVTKALDGLKDQAAQTSGAQTGLGTASREAAAGITAAAGANTGVAQAAKEAASRLDTQKNATAGASAALSTMAQAGGDASARVGMLVPVSQGLGKAAKTASDGLDQQAKSTNIAKDALDRMHKSAQTGIAGLGRLARMAGITGAALAASFSARALAATADGWSDMSSRIGAAVKDMDAAQGLMTDMLRLANASYSAIGQTVDTFASNIGPMRDLGYSTKEVLDYTESLNHMLVITATKGEQAASVQNALSKAMATGKMDAQGLETVLANGGRVAEALAKELGTTTSGLRKMASEGKLTGQVIARALLKSLEDVREEAAQMPSTIGDGLLRIGNGVTALIGSIDQALGASAAVADWLNGIAEGIGKIAAKDFSGLMDSMKNAAIGLGQALMVLAATRIPALIAGIAAINIQTALMTGRFIAGAAASRGMAAAIAAKTLAVRGLASALALAGGPLGLVAAGIAAVGVAFVNERRAAKNYADAIADLGDVQARYDRDLSDFHKNRTAENAAHLKQLADKRVEIAKVALEEARREVNRLKWNELPNMAGMQTPAMKAALAVLADMEKAWHDATAHADMMEHAVSNIAHETQTAADNTKNLSDAQKRAAETANDMLRSFQQRIQLAQIEAHYGRDSLAYQAIQIQHDRDALALRVNSLEISDDLKRSILEAADAANQAEGKTEGWDRMMSTLAGTTRSVLDHLNDIAAAEPPANWLEGAIGQASRLARALAAGIGMAVEVGGFSLPKKKDPIKPTRPGQKPDRTGKGKGKGKKTGGSGKKGRDDAAREAEQQRKAVTDLVAAMQLELDVLRETDPALAEMLRHRDTLAHATAAEKTKIEELIRTRLRETDAMAEAEQKMRDLQNEGRSAVQGIVQAMRDGQSAGNILADVLDRISRKLADMAANNLSDALFGNGKQGGGTGLLGGFLGGLFGGKTEVKANALGDVIGAPTLFAYSNKPGQLGVMGEAGAEAIMPLTHAMGGGVGALIGGRETTLPLTRLTSGKLGVTVPDRVTPFARGGAFGHVPQPPMDMRRGRSAPPQSAGLTGRLEISLSPDLRVEMQQIAGDVAVEVTKTGLEKYTRHVLPDQARRRVKDGRSVG